MNREMRRHRSFFPILGALSTIALLATIFTFGSAAAFDSVGMLRAAAAGNLTATVNGTGLQIDGTPLGTASDFVRISVPQATGTTPTLDVTLQISPDNSTWQTVVTFAQITAAGQYRRKLGGVGAVKAKYVRFAAVVGGTTPNFGAVQIGFETGSEYTG